MRIRCLSWFFLIAFVTVLSDAVLVYGGQCQSDQKTLLLRLNASLVLDRSISAKLVHWDQTQDCCNWHGVNCDSGGQVIGLNLSNESISGGIDNSSSLFDLQFLQRLNLDRNNFSSEIPSGFSKLTNLSYLNLSNARFLGQVPIEISRMRNLVTLDLSSFPLLGAGALKIENPNLTTLVRDLSELRDLRLDGINISTLGTEWCQIISSSLPKLQVLSLSRCSLSAPTSSSIAKLRFLSVIRLDQNNLSNTAPAGFADFSNLTALRLSFCELNGTFPAKIFQVPTLETLDLSNNKFLRGSLPVFPQNASLKNLVLSDTSFSGTLPDSIGRNRNLSRIDLAGCNFSGPIPSSMRNLTQLVYLDFSSNAFTGPIPPFHGSKNLTYLDLSRNKLKGVISSTHWQGLLNLVNVDLQNNSLNGSIPSSLFTLPSLQKLQLSKNQFVGHFPEFSNASFSSLDTLDLSSNRLEGPIPMSVFQLKRLNLLLLSFNKFNGSIKLARLWNLSNLTSIDLSYNKLSIDASGNYSNFSSFPQISTLKLASCNLKVFPDLRNQQKLRHLDLSDNQITGAIPSWIWTAANESLQHLNLSHNFLVELQEPYSSLSSLPSLVVLDLHYNQLPGKIPNPPSSATYVDYSSNNFSSFIPKDIGVHLFVTYFFSLSNNSLKGVIPESICKGGYLQVLDLSNNDLTGTVPPCLIGKSKTSVVLKLRGNRLNGSISDEFTRNCTLQTLDLNGNQIEGKFPKSIANCAKLEVLDLGNNQINDNFPCMLKNISSLRVLVLRVNKFYGDIVCPENNASWPMLQIVDLASNNFSGNISQNSITTWKAMIVGENGAQSKLDHIQFQFLPLSFLYYQDSVTITFKGLNMELVKILTVFTSIDFSCNKFQGPVPDVIGELTALKFLNLSQNALTGPIPSSLGNLRELESLDLSQNYLTGMIPQQLIHMTFLSALNLSHNQLAGRIPNGAQFNTFDNSSYEGNRGLCGSPLSKSCNTIKVTPPGPEIQNEDSRDNFDWWFIAIGLGFGVGAAVVVAPLMLCKKASKGVDDNIDKILLVILPMLGLMYTSANNGRIQPDESSDDDTEESNNDDEESNGRYCVFCTKLDMTRKKVIHDPHCTCHDSPHISSSSLFPSSSLSLERL
ncbi:receptor-like protein 12-like [Tripterygium wilfordii]|uniref:Receptor-like protein 12-like n=1 Tax=Tripterygium wilfordii TaxID=458696 RepID=A0A7J7DWY4_TRIWF|nr:receptor like protein 22-like [Tripterygium wilfordii]KAF5750801.1 receptor-like protein 12-like [Tripterygium wilfordii]